MSDMVTVCWAVRFIEVGIQCLNSLSGIVLVSHGSNLVFITSDLIEPFAVLDVVDENVQLLRYPFLPCIRLIFDLHFFYR